MEGARATRRAILKSFQMTVSMQGELTFGLDVEALEGLADSGNLSEDLTDVLVALGEAAQEQGSGLVFLFDEVQFLTTPELEALIAALHKTVQRQLPITLVGAGLPQLPRLAGEAKSYAERLFQFPTIGRLSDEEAADAVTRPAAPLGVTLTDDAVAAIVDYTLHAGSRSRGVHGPSVRSLHEEGAPARCPTSPRQVKASLTPASSS